MAASGIQPATPPSNRRAASSLVKLAPHNVSTNRMPSRIATARMRCHSLRMISRRSASLNWSWGPPAIAMPRLERFPIEWNRCAVEPASW
jgi:hypothetical protein